MKRTFLSLLFLSLLTTSLTSAPKGNNTAAIEKQLKSKYGMVVYHKDFSGWYFISYDRNGQTYYGMCDPQGNVIVKDATKYKQHDVYIEFYLLNNEQKLVHDQWKQEMKQYEKAYAKYAQTRAEYESKLAKYNADVEAAKQVALGKYNEARQIAIQRAQVANSYNNQTYNTGNVWADLAGNIANGAAKIANVATAANSVKYEPYEKAELAARNLTTPPTAPYNPEPKKPAEPSDGHYWKSFLLKQPSYYSYVDFAALDQKGCYADVMKNGKYGLLDFNLKEVVACTNNEKVKQQTLIVYKLQKIKDKGKIGLLDGESRMVLPCIYDDITLTSDNLLSCKKGGLYGIFNQSGKQILPCQYQEITKEHNCYKVKKQGSYGITTADGKDWYPCRYEELKIVMVENKLFLQAKQHALWGLFDFNTGVNILPYNFNDIKLLTQNSTGFFWVKKDNKCGLYSGVGTMLIPCEYSNIDLVTYQQKVYARVTKAGKIGLYDEDGSMIIPAEYSEIVYDKSEFLSVIKDGKKGIYTIWGEPLVECLYSTIKHDSKNNLFICSVGNDMTIVDMNGNRLFNPVLADQLIPHEKYITFSYRNRYGTLDYNGNILIPAKNGERYIPKKMIKYIVKNNIDQMNQACKEQLENASGDFNNKRLFQLSKRESFSFYAQNYVERLVNEWQRKGEFEKTDAWRMRVNNDTRTQQVYNLTKQAQDEYIDKHAKRLPQDVITIVGQYDPDNETYRLHSSNLDKDMLVPVPENEASNFRQELASAVKKPTYFIEDDKLSIAEYQFLMPNGKIYKYSNQASLTYNIAQVEYNFDAINVDVSALGGSHAGKQTISTSQIAIGRADVDIQIPVTSTTQENTFVVIFANQEYDDAPSVEFAFNDGSIFNEYCVKTLGIPKGNIHFRKNATIGNMRQEIRWIREEIAGNELFADKAKFIIYYTGHGIPDERTGSTYLLPKDGVVTDITNSGLKISELYNAFADINNECVIFLDACFSGQTKSGAALTQTRAVGKTINRGQPKGNCVVFSASSNNEVAHQYKSKGHGLFTYWLLKKLQDSKGETNYGGLFEFVKTKVGRTSAIEIKKSQTPTISYSPQATNNWKTRKLK